MINAWVFLWVLFFAVGLLIAYWWVVCKAFDFQDDRAVFGILLPTVMLTATMLLTSCLMNFARAVG